jgi:synaptotagmin-7
VRVLTLSVFLVADPYVKVWLQFGDKRIEKRKTAIFKCTLNPVFNDTFSFNVPWEKIRECSLDVMVMDFDNIGRNELIGRILLAGMKRKRLRHFSVCNLRNV